MEQAIDTAPATFGLFSVLSGSASLLAASFVEHWTGHCPTFLGAIAGTSKNYPVFALQARFLLALVPVWQNLPCWLILLVDRVP